MKEVGRGGREEHYRKNEQKKKCHLQRKGNLRKEKGEGRKGNGGRMKKGDHKKIGRKEGRKSLVHKRRESKKGKKEGESLTR